MPDPRLLWIDPCLPPADWTRPEFWLAPFYRLDAKSREHPIDESHSPLHLVTIRHPSPASSVVPSYSAAMRTESSAHCPLSVHSSTFGLQGKTRGGGGQLLCPRLCLDTEGEGDGKFLPSTYALQALRKCPAGSNIPMTRSCQGAWSNHLVRKRTRTRRNNSGYSDSNTSSKKAWIRPL
jgi:hypothetical protein